MEHGRTTDNGSLASSPDSGFLSYFEQHSVVGSRPSYHEEDDGPVYLPDDARKAFYSDDNLIIRLLRKLYPNQGHGPPPQPVSVVQRSFTKVLSILLWTRWGYTFHRFMPHPSLADDKLPFYSKPALFPDSSDDALWLDFNEHQWKFCAPKMEYYRRVDWDERLILPFVRVEKLGEGSSGTAYRIDVEPSHDLLVNDQKRPSNRLPGFSPGLRQKLEVS